MRLKLNVYFPEQILQFRQLPLVVSFGTKLRRKPLVGGEGSLLYWPVRQIQILTNHRASCLVQ